MRRAALAIGLVHELAPADQVVERARRWVLEEGDPVAPWDKKGFKIPGGGLMSPGTMQTFMVGNALLANGPAPRIWYLGTQLLAGANGLGANGSAANGL